MFSEARLPGFSFEETVPRSSLLVRVSLQRCFVRFLAGLEPLDTDLLQKKRTNACHGCQRSYSSFGHEHLFRTAIRSVF